MKWLKNGFEVQIKYFCCYCFRKIILVSLKSTWLKSLNKCFKIPRVDTI